MSKNRKKLKRAAKTIDIDQLYRKAESLFRSNKLDDAERVYKSILDVKPDHYPSLIRLAKMALEAGVLPAALNYAKLAVNANHAMPQGHQFLGNIFSILGLVDQAESECTIAAQLDNQNSSIINSLGNIYAQQGRFDEALETFRRAIVLDPDYMASYYNLATSKKFMPDDPDIDLVEGLLNKVTSGDSKEQVYIHFALGKLYHDCGKYDDAFVEYRKGNQLKLLQANFDINSREEFVNRIVGVQNNSWYEQRHGKGCQSDGAIFIVGMPRSGTTLLETLLCRHSMVSGIGEPLYMQNLAAFCMVLSTEKIQFPEVLNELSDIDYKRLGEEYISLSHQYGVNTNYTVDKTPQNFLYLGFILAILPNAKIVHNYRDPVDTCLSIYQQLFTGGQEFAFDLRTIGQYYLLYLKLMDHWKQIFPSRILDVNYEDVVSDTEKELRRVTEFCGLPWDDQCLSENQQLHVSHTASKWQARQPVYKSSVRRWKKYEKHLGPLLEVLSPVIE